LLDPRYGYDPQAEDALRFARRLRPLLLLGFALLLYLPLLGRRDIVTGHEARVAQTAREMARTWPWQNGEADRLHVDRVVLTDIGSGVLRLYPATDGSTVSVNPWLVPVLQGLIRLQKPPLPYWCAAVPLKLFSGGNLGTGWARFVPALMGAFGVLFMYDLARLTIGRAGAWAAGLVWVSSYLPFEEYRLAMPDPYLAFFTLVCVWAWFAAGKSLGSSRKWGSRKWWGSGVVAWWSNGRERTQLPHYTTTQLHLHTAAVLVLFYVSLALGVLAKGPLIFLHVGIALAAYHVCYRRRPPGRVWQHLLGVAVFAAVAVPWAVYVYRQVPDAAAVWRYESVGELSNNRENVRPWWFYAPAALQISLPWAPVWLAGLVLPFVRRRRGRLDRRAFFPLIWYGATVVFFSLVNQKKDPYLLPVLPAQVLLIARALVALIGHARLTWARGGKGNRRKNPHPDSLPDTQQPAIPVGSALRTDSPESGITVRSADPTKASAGSIPNYEQCRPREPVARRDEAGYLLGAQAVLGAACAVVLAVLVYRENRDAPVAGVALACLVGLAAGLLPLWLLLRRPRRWLVAQALGYAILVLLAFEGVVTPRDNRRSARPVCEVATALLHRPGTTILTDVFTPGSNRLYFNVLAEEAAVYLPLGINDRPGHRVLLLFDDQENVALRKKAGQYAGNVPPGDGPVDEMYLRKWDAWTGGGRVTSAVRIPVPGQAGDVRWKLFELVVDRKSFAITDVADPPFSGPACGALTAAPR
jgi:4-amino-4-deoxy-L-arabinose transferase-like glycosyltransferase